MWGKSYKIKLRLKVSFVWTTGDGNELKDVMIWDVDEDYNEWGSLFCHKFIAFFFIFG